MKTIFTLLLSTIFSVASIAYDGTRLTVTSVSQNKMFVEVNGRRYSLNGNTVSIGNIRPGTYNVRVLRELKRKSGWNSGIGRNREEVIYSIRLTLRDGYHFDILLNRFGKVLIDERRIDRNDDWYTDEDDRYFERDGGRDEDWEERDDTRDRANKDWDDDENMTDSDPREDINDRDAEYDDEYSRSMSDFDFSQAKETLRKEWFENTRMTTAKQIIDRNYFTSQQVKDLLLLFTFENNRLDLAKYAYGKTVDKGNYFIVNDAFTFNSNKEKLGEYIRDYK
ncbi:MAG TPA: DUF4476 domain-containing protein [Chitinophagaceae bacterium]|nr:DUF4476 domain-containing protein [Chitinophagaceae bacterium]